MVISSTPVADAFRMTMVDSAMTHDETGWLEAKVGGTGFQSDIVTRHHRLTADEPESAGGNDAGPTPYEFLLAAVATCTAMTIRMYANRKQWPLESASVFVRQGRSYVKDCEDCATHSVGMGKVERRVELSGQLTEEQRARLLEIADRCPLKQTLGRGIEVT